MVTDGRRFEDVLRQTSTLATSCVWSASTTSDHNHLKHRCLLTRTAVHGNVVEHQVQLVLLGATAGKGSVTRAGRRGLIRGLVTVEERLAVSAQALVAIGDDEEQVASSGTGLETRLPERVR